MKRGKFTFGSIDINLDFYLSFRNRVHNLLSPTLNTGMT